MQQGKNVKLRSLRESDMMVLFRWINDPDLIKFTNSFRPISETEQKIWFQSISQRSDLIVLGIELKRTKNLIGTCSLSGIDWQSRKAELRIKVGDRSNRGKGYGRDAIRLLIDFAFNDLNLKRLWLRVLTTNTRAIQLYSDVGFRKEGVLKKDIYIQGVYHDVAIMGLLKEYLVRR